LGIEGSEERKGGEGGVKRQKPTLPRKGGKVGGPKGKNERGARRTGRRGEIKTGEKPVVGDVRREIVGIK